MRTKILHITQATGGVETSLLLLFRYLDRDRFELHLACPPGTSLADQSRKLGVQVWEIPMVRAAHPLADFLGLRRLVAIMRRERFDIVHGHSAKGGYLARLAGRIIGGVKVVYHPRAFSFLSQRGPARAFFLMLERVAVQWTDLLIATSESERQRAINNVRFPPDRVVVVPNSVDVSEVNGGLAKQENGFKTVLTVGRLSFQKNPEMFVRVAKRVAAFRDDVQFVMLGGGFAGPLERRTRNFVVASGLGGRVTILPWRSKAETLQQISACDVFVLTSRFEGMPNTLLEALMLGRPAVTTDVDGNRDVLAAGGGRVVPLDGDEAMATRILEYLNDPKRAAEDGQRGRQQVREHFAIVRNVERLEIAYRSLLNT